MKLTQANYREEYIHGDRFHALADFTLTIDYPIVSSDIFEKDGVIFCNGDFILGLFKALQKSTRSYILITHNSDLNITEEVYAQKPQSVKFWYAQNVCTNKEDLHPIPIGLEREQIIPTRNIEETTYKMFCEGIYTPKKKFAYLNINHRTNRIERTNLKMWFPFKWWVTYKQKRTHEQYINDIFNHKFTFSPPGNGEDCHRTWEALYLGSIPIVKRSVMTEYFSKQIPMFLYDEIKEITYNKLKQFYHSIDNTQRDESILLFSYWKDLIKNKRKELKI